MASQLPAFRLFPQPLVQAQIKENIKAPRHWPLCGEFTGDRWIPAQRTSNAENVAIWWRHHETTGNMMSHSRWHKIVLSPFQITHPSDRNIPLNIKYDHVWFGCVLFCVGDWMWFGGVTYSGFPIFRGRFSGNVATLCNMHDSPVYVK